MIHDSNYKVEDWEAFIQEHYGENCCQSSEDIDVTEVTQIDENTEVQHIIKQSNLNTKKKVLDSKNVYKTLEAREHNNTFNEINFVPIKDVFRDRLQDIQAFRGDGTEVYKVLLYILYCDLKVMKSQAGTVDVKFKMFRDRFILTTDTSVGYECRGTELEKEAFRNLRMGKFTLEKVLGSQSEEAQILKACSCAFKIFA